LIGTSYQSRALSRWLGGFSLSQSSRAASAGRSRIVSRLAVLSVGISVGMKLTGLPKNWIAEDIVRIADGCNDGASLLIDSLAPGECSRPPESNRK